MPVMIKQLNPLNVWLLRNGITKKAFAEKMGCSYRTICGICKGDRHPSRAMAKKIEIETFRAVKAVDLLSWHLEN